MLLLLCAEFWQPPARLMLRLESDVGTGIHLSPTGIEIEERRLGLGNRAEVSVSRRLRVWWGLGRGLGGFSRMTMSTPLRARGGGEGGAAAGGPVEYFAMLYQQQHLNCCRTSWYTE